MAKQFPANTLLEVQPDARPGVNLVHVETMDRRQTLFSVPAKYEALITEMVLAHNAKINASEGR